MVESRIYEDDFNGPTSRGGGKARSIGRPFWSGLNSGLKTGLGGRFANPDYIPALYSAKSEAVVKVISYSRGHRVKIALDYISRIDTEKKPDVECEDEFAQTVKGEKAVLKVYDRWRQDFDRAKPGLSRKKRDAAHIMLSSDCKNTEENAAKVLAAAREAIEKEIGEKGFEYVAALHKDSGNPHVHFVIKCHNKFKGQPKLRLNPPEIFQIRTRFAQKMTELGLDHVATLRKDRPNIIAMVNQGVDQLQKNERQFQRAMRRAAPTQDAFLYRKNASKLIVRLRDQVKKNTEPETKKRRELLAALRSMERQITKNRPGAEKEIAATFRKYGQEFGQFRKAVTQAEELPQESKKRQQIDTIIKKNRKAFESKLDIARQFIKESTAPEQTKQDSLYILAQYEKDMKLAHDKGRVSSENKAFIQEAAKSSRLGEFGYNIGLKDRYSSLNDTVKSALAVKKLNPETAVEKLKKKRALESLSTQLAQQVSAARADMKKIDLGPEKKNQALADLRQLEKRVFAQYPTRKRPQVRPRGKAGKAVWEARLKANQKPKTR
ncbi:relaxase/mobilization nuclease domain-containing protein [Desulfospira joergensenii]|uniref:relaxase/mobilization nuclease domain-containing protein n=1 Tax=Desulfospira joergensenii TaxID=53329 RepID=UPI0003B75EF8|nr:relaxase/mobilization nuclease domain-containing protein [Desulfospira joergensenii]